MEDNCIGPMDSRGMAATNLAHRHTITDDSIREPSTTAIDFNLRSHLPTDGISFFNYGSSDTRPESHSKHRVKNEDVVRTYREEARSTYYVDM